MFGEMFGMLERLTALLATILVSRHGIPLTRIPHVVLAVMYRVRFFMANCTLHAQGEGIFLRSA
jgi:hypothetical protein